MSIQLSTALDELGIDGSGDGLTENTTVNLDSSMTRSEIQALINAQPKNLNGYTLRFQFADGTYDLDGQVEFGYFYGGILYIWGNESDNTGFIKSVHLDFSDANCHGVYLRRCACSTYVQYFKITVETTNSRTAVYCNECPGTIRLFNNYLLGTSNSLGYAMYGYYCNVIYAYSNYISNIYGCIRNDATVVHSRDNDDTGTQPKYGLLAYNAGTIGKQGTQPTALTADEYTNGGQIL